MESGDASDAYDDGVHPLLRAIVACDTAAVAEHLAINPEAVNTRFEDSLTPLMHAVIAGDVEVVDLLLQKGADVAATTEDRMYGEGGSYKLCVVGGRTIMHLAFAHGRTELASKFEALGVPTNVADLNGDLPGVLSAQRLDNCSAVRGRMMKVKHAPSAERDQELSDMLGVGVQQVFLSNPDSWQTRRICGGVFMLRCFTDDTCARIIHLIGQVSRDGEAANSMSRYGRRLRDTLVDYLISRNMDVINDMIARSFPEETAPVVMRDHYTFAIRYALGKDEFLGTHSDRSAFTLNICLAASCEGSEVYFEHDDGTTIEVKHEPGWGVLHVGGIDHGARKLKSGTRENLVVWLYG